MTARRFCGSRTPGPVGTSGSWKLFSRTIGDRRAVHALARHFILDGFCATDRKTLIVAVRADRVGVACHHHAGHQAIRLGRPSQLPARPRSASEAVRFDLLKSKKLSMKVLTGGGGGGGGTAVEAAGGGVERRRRSFQTDTSADRSPQPDRACRKPARQLGQNTARQPPFNVRRINLVD